MTKKQVTLTARIKIKPGLEERFKQEYLPVVNLTRSEEGCLNYNLHQSVEDPSLFLLYENWVSQESLAKHLEMPYIKALSEKAREFLAEPVAMQLWQQLS